MMEATFRCRTSLVRRCGRQQRFACDWGWTQFSLAAVLLRIRRRPQERKCGGAQRSPCSSEHRHRRSRTLCTGSGIRMKIGLSQEEQVQEAATNQVDSQRRHSARASATDNGRRVSEVLQGVETALPAGASSLEIRQVACDSRKVQPGALFFALHGAKADGNTFIQDALKRGAVAIASEEQAPGTTPAGVVWIQVREARKALAMTAAN